MKIWSKTILFPLDQPYVQKFALSALLYSRANGLPKSIKYIGVKIWSKILQKLKNQTFFEFKEQYKQTLLESYL